MLSESEQRAAILAVSRYGADSSRVSLVVQSMVEPPARTGMRHQICSTFRSA